MISADAARFMAQYNAWQNQSVLQWASSMSDEERRRDRGVFWGSVMGTLNHVLWADTVWMHRLTGSPKPEAGLKQSGAFTEQWEMLTRERRRMDNAIQTWTAGLQDVDLSGDLSWYSGALGRDMVHPRWRLVLHMFNHQTHHRGQLHAMATGAGLRPDDTDMPFMPEPK